MGKMTLLPLNMGKGSFDILFYTISWNKELKIYADEIKWEDFIFFMKAN